MAADEGVDTSRTRVQTYVPGYQEDEWRRHAEQLDMSLSEFVRSMVQAGRRGFNPDSVAPAEPDSEEPSGAEESGSDPRGVTLEDRVVDILSEGEYYDWEEIVAALTDDIEDQLEETLQELQSENRVRYSGRNGGYALE